MRLLAELLGTLCVAAMVGAVLRAGPARGRGSLRAGLTAVAIVIGGLAFWTGVWPAARDLVRQHSRDARLTAEQALALPGTALPATSGPAREDVLAWAARSLPAHARVFLDCPQPAPCSNALANWITYRLQPRVFTDLPAQAQWILFYGASPQSLPPSVDAFAPGYAIARAQR